MGSVGFKVIGIVVGLLMGKVTRKLLDTTWRKTKGAEPPENPASPATPWGEAVTWAVASGVAVAVSKLIATKGTATAYTKATGHPPAGLESKTKSK
jgi:hypothetical protein